MLKLEQNPTSPFLTQKTGKKGVKTRAQSFLPLPHPVSVSAPPSSHEDLFTLTLSAVQRSALHVPCGRSSSLSQATSLTGHTTEARPSERLLCDTSTDAEDWERSSRLTGFDRPSNLHSFHLTSFQKPPRPPPSADKARQ